MNATNAPAKTELLTGIGQQKGYRFSLWSFYFSQVALFDIFVLACDHECGALCVVIPLCCLNMNAALSALSSRFAVCESGPCYDTPMNLALCGAQARVNIYWVCVRCTAGGRAGQAALNETHMKRL
jgi:hypothetical protein